MINSLDFMHSSKIGKNSFMRKRKLTFKRVIIFMMMKSVKSLQNSLNEFFDKLTDKFETVSASAYSKARRKLSHKAFVALNEKAILEVFYSEEAYKTYKGFRVLGIDGSRIYLPNTDELADEFGKIEIKNQKGHSGNYVSGLASVMYDVLNNFAIDSILVRNDAYEGDLALEHLKKTEKKDLIIGDRGYPSYTLIASIIKENRNFLFRCSRASFTLVNEMFSSNVNEKIVSLKVPRGYKNKNMLLGLDEKITVRLIKIILDDGETEVLMTSLLDKKKYPISDFKKLYWQRWGIETFFDLLKNRLSLENFTGKSKEAVLQDFYSTILVSNLETMMTIDTEKKLKEKSIEYKNPVKVNKSIAFNIIKNKIIDLLLYDNGKNTDKLLEQMAIIFEQRPTPIRNKRSYPRDKTALSKKLDFHKRRKKQVF